MKPAGSAGLELASTKRLFIHRLFTTIAPRYDWFNRLASFSLDQRWRREAIMASGVSRGMDVLDVCTGTGDLALLCATHLSAPTAVERQAGTDGKGLVVGLDFNEQMLRAASHKQRACLRPRLPRSPMGGQGAQQGRQASGLCVHWLEGDAQELPFCSASFDRVFIGFSTRNLSDLELGIREMLRVLKPHGQLVVLETGRPSNRFLRAGYLLFLHTGARLIGWLLTGRLWPFTYLARSVKGFLRPAEFVSLLTACGTKAHYIPLSWGLASLYVAQKSQ